MRRVLLLDVMGTLVYDPIEAELPAFFGLTQAELFAQIEPGAWVDFERGAIDEEEYRARFFRDRRRFDGDALRACLGRAYRWLEGTEALLRELAAAGVEMHALSNYPCWYELIEAALGLSRYVPWTFVSVRTATRKPAPEAYLGAANALSIAPSDCVFVDDRGLNCKAAAAVGMRAIRFRDTATLRVELARLGFPVDA